MSDHFYINNSNTITNEESDGKKYLLTSDAKSVKSIVFVGENLSYKDIFIHALFDGLAFFFVTLGIYLSNGKPENFIFSFWAAFMIFGNLSGAHINAMVTVSLWIYNGNMFSNYNMIKLLFYILAQFMGVLLGSVFSRFISVNDIVYVVPKDIPELRQFITELFFSGTLVFVALFISSASTRPTNKNYINLTILAIWLYIIIKDGGNISGGNYNPTIYLVLNGFARFYDGNEDAFNDFWALTIAPFVGGILFMLVFKYLFRPYYIRNNKKCITDVE
jgi:glycerol uptake facilitator-like aquaporin